MNVEKINALAANARAACTMRGAQGRKLRALVRETVDAELAETDGLASLLLTTARARSAGRLAAARGGSASVLTPEEQEQKARLERMLADLDRADEAEGPAKPPAEGEPPEPAKPAEEEHPEPAKPAAPTEKPAGEPVRDPEAEPEEQTAAARLTWLGSLVQLAARKTGVEGRKLRAEVRAELERELARAKGTVRQRRLAQLLAALARGEAAAAAPHRAKGQTSPGSALDEAALARLKGEAARLGATIGDAPSSRSELGRPAPIGRAAEEARRRLQVQRSGRRPA